MCPACSPRGGLSPARSSPPRAMLTKLSSAGTRMRCKVSYALATLRLKGAESEPPSTASVSERARPHLWRGGVDIAAFRHPVKDYQANERALRARVSRASSALRRLSAERWNTVPTLYGEALARSRARGWTRATRIIT